MDPDEEFENVPELDKVAYDVAIEAIVTIYRGLRSKGLARRDSAAVVAAILKMDDELDLKGDTNGEG